MGMHGSTLGVHESAIGVDGNAWEHSGSAIGINGNAWEHSGSPWDSMPRGIHRDMSEIRSRPGQWGVPGAMGRVFISCARESDELFAGFLRLQAIW